MMQSVLLFLLWLCPPLGFLLYPLGWLPETDEDDW